MNLTYPIKLRDSITGFDKPLKEFNFGDALTNVGEEEGCGSGVVDAIAVAGSSDIIIVEESSGHC